MITDISIENFKALKELNLNGLNRISLVSGRNNVGKSTLLEALFLYMDHLAVDSFGKLSMFRGTIAMGANGLWNPLFYQMNTQNPIIISVKDDGEFGKLKYERDDSYLPNNISGISESSIAHFRAENNASYSLGFTYIKGNYNEKGHFSLNNSNGVLREVTTSLPGNEAVRMKQTQFMGTRRNAGFDYLVNQLGSMELQGEKKLLINALKEMDPSIEDVLTLSVQGLTQIYIRTDGRLVPLYYAGDGIYELVGICLAIEEQKNGLVLIDELETGLHYSMYEQLWKTIDYISERFNCQVIATTHSYELISAVTGGLSSLQDFSYYRIGKEDNISVAHRYDYDMLDSALKSDMEVR